MTDSNQSRRAMKFTCDRLRDDKQNSEVIGFVIVKPLSRPVTAS